MTLYPYPREGIIGIDRNDNLLLSLDDASEIPRKAVVSIGIALWRMALHGAISTKDNREMYERMDKPQPGDLVVEVTRTDWHQGLGYLIEHRQECAYTEQQWAEREEPEAGDPHMPVTDAWYIQYGPDPDDVCRWENACFVALPTGPRGQWIE